MPAIEREDTAQKKRLKEQLYSVLNYREGKFGQPLLLWVKVLDYPNKSSVIKEP